MQWLDSSYIYQGSRWGIYSDFITYLKLGDEDLPDQDRALLFMLGASRLAVQNLLPRLRHLEIAHSWLKNRSGFAFLSHLHSVELETVKLSFTGEPPSALLYGCFKGIISRSSHLKDLTLYNSRTFEGHLHPEDNEHLSSSIPLLKTLTSLETLRVDPEWVTVELLDALGSLPMLRCFEAFHTSSPIVTANLNIAARPKNTIKLSNLLSFSLQSGFSNLNRIVKRYLTGDERSSLQRLTFASPEPSANVDDFEFIGLVSKTLRDFRLEQFDEMSQPPSVDCLAPFVECKSLTVLHLQTYRRLDYGEPAFTQLLMYCPGLEELELSELELQYGRSALSGTPSQIEEENGSGLHLSLLQAIGRHLPKIKIVKISVIACDANELASDDQIHRMKCLESLIFSASLLNRRRPGFSAGKAARFISALIMPRTTFQVSRLPAEDFGPEESWLKFVHDYNKFAEKLEERVSDYVEIRKGEHLVD